MIILEQTLSGAAITCRAQRLDYGLQVLLTGGTQSHIGAWTLAQPGQAPVTTVLPGHKEQFLSEPWAERLATEIGEPVLVVCGIHYDNATRGQIDAVLAVCEVLLNQLLTELNSSEHKA